ncbi:MAG TPA: hypothetical protein VEA15_05685 [Caulobacteraceae bacterium]|nr:hypothetical protein [Caulobacteraceae bacterium]
MADMEEQVAEAIRAELERQAEGSSGLTVRSADAGLSVEGEIDLEALAMAVVGAVAGGP